MTTEPVTFNPYQPAWKLLFNTNELSNGRFKDYNVISIIEVVVAHSNGSAYVNPADSMGIELGGWVINSGNTALVYGCNNLDHSITLDIEYQAIFMHKSITFQTM